MACVEEGSIAPDFELQDQNGGLFRLSSMRGRYVVLYFYPKAMTKGCTIEAIEFRDSYDKIVSLGAVVVGVSKDSVEDIKKFSQRYNLPFTLLADPEGKVIKLYCVQGPFGLAKRVTFLIDDRGVVRRKWGKVNPLGHAMEVIKAIEELRR
ncbi:MAG: peroxiredoxin [Desulfurococcales archaeon]|nr:peroxiredoxin [Desulfurococcales archaeon]